MLIQETHIDATRECIVYESEPYPTADTDTPGDIFRAFQGEYGRCASRVYVDTNQGPKAVGWVFTKLERYEDTREKFEREVWVTLLDSYEVPRPIATYHYLP